MNSMVRLGGTLLAISAIAALALGATNQVTAPVIEQRNIQENNELRKAVLPEAKEFKEMDKSTYKDLGDGLIAEVYEGLDGSEVVGYTLKAKPSGYGGEIEVMVGISSEGQVTVLTLVICQKQQVLEQKLRMMHLRVNTKEKLLSLLK